MAEIDLFYAVGRVRALETRILSREDIERLCESPNRDKALSDTGYGAGAEGETFDALIRQELSLTRQEISYLLPADAAAVLLLPYDAHNLKVCLKQCVAAARAGRRPETAAAETAALIYQNTVYDPEIVAACARAGEFSLLSDTVAGILNPLYDEGKLNTPLTISAACDYAFTEEAAGKLASQPSLIRDAFRMKRDFENLLCLLRAGEIGLPADTVRTMLLPGGEIPSEKWLSLYGKKPEETVSALEGTAVHDGAAAALLSPDPSAGAAKEIFEAAVLSELQKGRYDSDTVIPVFLYFLQKEQEAETIRRVFSRI